MVTESLSVQVAGKRQASQDVVSLELVAPEGGLLPEFSPGAHIDVYLPGGFIRQYSLLNDCLQRTHFLIGVLREPQSRGGSAAVHDQVQIGDVLRISLPRNRFPLVPAERSLLFAGGIGITPLLCMARRLLATGAAFDLHYSCRTRSGAAFLDEIQDPGLGAHARVDFDDDAQTALDARAVLAGADAGTHVYVCGPWAISISSSVRPARPAWTKPVSILNALPSTRISGLRRLPRGTWHFRSSCPAPEKSSISRLTRPSHRPWTGRACPSLCPARKVAAAPT